jgi:hypothetical protein
MLRADGLRRFLLFLSCAVAAALIGGCGGGGGGNDTPQPTPPLQGVFVDSPVQGLGYTATPSGLTGVTDARGQFNYRAGDRITFLLYGRVVASDVPAAPVVTVLSAFNATSVSDSRVINLTRLLLTLAGVPAAGNPIALPAAEPPGLPAAIDFTAANFDQAFPGLTLVADTVALAHLRENFATLSATRNGAGAGAARVASTPAGIDCGAACSADFLKGTGVTLVVSGAGFTGWSGACQGTGSCVVALGTDTAVSAAFSGVPVTANLTVSRTGSGAGTVTSTPAGIDCGSTCSARFAQGSVQLTATPAAGSSFAGWTSGTGNASCAGTGVCAIALAADSSIVATFTLNSVQVTVTASVASANGGGGTVSCSANGGAAGTCGSYAPGTQVTLTAQPNGVSNFTGWSGGGCSGTAPCTLTVTSNVAVTANFNRPTLNVQVAGAGRVTSSPAGIDCTTACVAAFDKASQVTLTALGSVFAGWSGGGCTGTGACVVTMDQGAQIVATFTPMAFPHFAPQASLVAPNVAFSSLFGAGVALSGDTLVVGTPGDASNARGINGDPANNVASNSGAVNVYTRANGVWTHQAYIKASNAEAGDTFGTSVAISGDTLVVGAPAEDSQATGVDGDQANNGSFASGAVYVFTRTAGVWSQQAYLKASNTGAGDEFGASVAISGDTLVVGAHFESSGATGVNGDGADNSKASSGAAYVFSRTGTTWRQTAYLKASNTTAGDEFGFSVAVSSTTIAIGAYHEGSAATGVNGPIIPNGASGSGAVYVFTGSGDVWTQQAYVKASNNTSLASFGWSVALSGDTLAVGAPKESNFGSGVGANQSVPGGADSGAVYVFTRSGSTWSQQVYIKASNTGLFDDFGWSVALAGDILAVGSPFEDSSATGVNGDQRNDNVSNAGAAYVFRRVATTWTQVDYVKSANTGPAGTFGNSVALTADTLAAGASGEFRGSVYMFVAP